MRRMLLESENSSPSGPPSLDGMGNLSEIAKSGENPETSDNRTAPLFALRFIFNANDSAKDGENIDVMAPIFLIWLFSLQPDSSKNEGVLFISAQDRIYASYINKSPDGLTLEEITFKKNHTFSYLSGTDIDQVSTSGTWEKIKDTFIVNSFLKRDDLPVSILEFTDTNSDSLVFDWVKNSSGDIMKGATIFINGDTTKGYMPVWDECRFAKGSVEKIRLTFDNHSSTKWYSLKNKYNAKISITLNVNVPLVNYVFFHRMKFLAKQDRLYELNEFKDMGNIKANKGHIDEHYFLTRKKEQ